MSVCKPILLEKFAPQKIVYTGIQSSALQYAAFIHMLVSPSDFNARPIGRALWKDLLVLSRFHSELHAYEWNYCP